MITSLAPIRAFATTCSAGFSPVIEHHTALNLRGSGTARYLLFRVYDAALYTPAEKNYASAASSQTACLEICYHRALEAEAMITAANQVLSRQNNVDELTNIHPQVEQLHSAYRPVKAGDRYRLCRNSDRLSLALNGEQLIEIDDGNFAGRYLDIWLGNRPLSASLRTALLAGE